MKNWAKEHSAEIKKWLDISKYRDFEKVTLNALYHELWARAIWYRNWPSEEEELERLRCEANIFGGNPFLFTPEQLTYTTRDDVLYQPPHIFLTTTTRLAQLSITAMLNEFFHGMEVQSIGSNLIMLKHSFLKQVSMSQREPCSLKSIY